MISKLAQRLLVFFIGVPVVIALVCLRQQHHLALHLALMAASVCAALELHAIFSHSFRLQHKAFIALLALVVPLSAFLCAFFSLPLAYIDYTFIGAVLLSLAAEVITAQSFEHSNARLMASTFIILYSGYLPTFISKMTVREHSVALIAVFLLMVFMCDSIAWLFGNLFGKSNRGIIKASPNKSVAGFIGGFVGAAASGLAGRAVWANVFTGSPAKVVALGLLIAFCAITGDLVESVFKRSANCKDSGSIVPGRGGVLDSVDSIFFAAPVYYLTSTLFFF